ncbi:MAG: glycerol kinase GlpK [Actinomycetota bacterium]|nr:glycerol kinase GlpK [Actinomycetota bacterium]
MGSHILAIDQGTTGTKALVVTPDADVAGQAYSEFQQHYPRPGWVEHDPEEIWDVSRRVAEQAVDAAGLDAADVAAIGITNQRETTVLWDRATGQPVHNAIVWQDRRTAGLCDRLKAEGLQDPVRHRTGLVIDAYFSGTKVAWLLEHVEGLRERAEAGEVCFGTIDSWLVWKLSGGRSHVTDYTNASRTLLYDIYQRHWDGELLEHLAIPHAVLPEVVASSGQLAETANGALLTDGIPVAGIAGDQQAALFAQACYEQGLAKNTYGTGSFVLMNQGTEVERVTRGPLATIAWGIGDEPVEYALEGAIFVTGSAVQWLRDELRIIDDAGETEELAASVDSNDDVYLVPALTGLGAPHWDPYARGTVVGLTRGTSRAHLVRATLESIAYQTRDVVVSMTQETGIALEELRADGGAVANRWLMQFQADILGVPVVIPRITETTALGSAYLAGLATGVWSGKDELAERWTVETRYEPAMGADQREALHARWQQAVDRARDWARAE